MQSGELIVARVSGGLSIVRLLSIEDARARIATGRNREARIPVERVVLSTAIIVSEETQAEEFRQRCAALSETIDLTEVWEVVRDEATPLRLDDLAELYWGVSPEAAQRIALLLHLEQATLYFVNDKERYTPHTEAYVQEVLVRRQREAENAQAAEVLMEHLSRRALPTEMTSYQSTLLSHLRGYAVHGDNYTRSAVARSLLEKVDTDTRDLQRRSFELLVGAGVFSPDEPLELERAGIGERFPDAALAEAATIDLTSVLAQPHRRDLTALAAVTIDDAETEDRDDALSLELEATGLGPQAAAIYRIGIHIADAGALVPPGSALDQEADRRMATLYMPERKVNMLPEQIANRVGSLNPGESRATLSLLARITEAGEVLDWEVVPSLIRSQAAIPYDEVDMAIGDPTHPRHAMLASLDKVARSLRRKRDAAGAVSLERPEMTIKASPSGEVKVGVLPRAAPARQLVAEFMILCNSLLAEFCRRESIPAPYRSQATPDLEDLGEMEDGPLRWYMVMRRLAPADLNTTPAHHGGLGVPAYIQASSPLRRYPDLVVQRQISAFLRTGKPLYLSEAIASVAQRADVQLRELSKIEGERERYWFLKYLRESLSKPNGEGEAGLFAAIVLENQPGRPALLELAAYPFRVRAQLPQSSAPGDTVTLRLHGVDLWRRIGHFVHVP